MTDAQQKAPEWIASHLEPAAELAALRTDADELRRKLNLCAVENGKLALLLERARVQLVWCCPAELRREINQALGVSR